MEAAFGRRHQALPLRQRLRRYGSFAQDALLIVITALFFKIHVENALGGRLTSVPFAVEQGLLVGLFLTRRRSAATSTQPLDWVVASGGWLPFAFRPAESHGGAWATAGISVQMTGLILTIGCFAALGRSFGVVAANRGLKTGGPYSLVRHPVYAAHIITMSGFLVANFHLYNAALYVVIVAFQLLRIRAEERVLVATSDYGQYRDRVPWRLVPHIY